MTSPEVSVLLPVRNGARTLPAALASVRAQRFERWEAVIVDDGSTDGTPAVLAEAARHDARLQVVRIPPSGIEIALNHGLTLCRAPIVARLDADDMMHRDRLGEQLRLMQRSSVAGVAALVRCFPRRTMRDGLRRYESWLNGLIDPVDIAAARFVEAPMVHPSVMLQRSVLQAHGGWRSSPWAEDWDLWLRLMEAGCSFAKVPRVLCFWRDHPERLTRTHSRYSLEAMAAIRAHYLARGPLRGRSAVIWGAGPIGKALMKALDRESAVTRALVDIDPRKIGQRVHGRSVIPPEGLRSHSDAVLLGAVGSAGAREEIRQAAVGAGYVDGRTFFACA